MTKTTVDNITDFDKHCAACGVYDRVDKSRYCEGCREALTEWSG